MNKKITVDARTEWRIETKEEYTKRLKEKYKDIEIAIKQGLETDEVQVWFVANGLLIQKEESIVRPAIVYFDSKGNPINEFYKQKISLAKVLFQELGFEKLEFDDLIYYLKVDCMWGGVGKIEIRFHKNEHKIFDIKTTMDFLGGDLDVISDINIDLYKAITQQMKELGWLDE